MGMEAELRPRAIVLAGGIGERLREMTRLFAERPLPKQFCGFGRPRTLLQSTVTRVTRAVPASRTTVVVQKCWEAVARAQLPEHQGVGILAQPCDRGTAAAVLLALVCTQPGAGDAPVLLTPSDHGFMDDTAFLRGVAVACESVAADRAGIVLLGAQSDSPRTDYGWIVPSARGGPDVRQVAEFVEKPAPPRARALLRAGALWNTMVLIAGAGALLDLYRKRRPEDVAILQRARVEGHARLRQAFESLPQADFSRDVLAGAPDLFVLPLPDGAGWTDLGTPERMQEFLGHGRGFNGERIEMGTLDPAPGIVRLAARGPG